MTDHKPIVTIDRLHACIVVKNMEASINWYHDLLGFNVIQQYVFSDSVRVAYLELNGVEIEFVENKNIKSFIRSDPPTEHVAIQGISQLSFRVDNLCNVMESLDKQSIKIVYGPVDAEALKLKALFIRDNEGNLLEFIQRY
ncbi:MAG: VOC family protein [Methylococcales bacterium]